MARGKCGGHTGESSATKSRYARTLAMRIAFSAYSAREASTSPRQTPDAHVLSVERTRFSCRAAANGGPGRDRTGDLIVANDALSQLSYRPLYTTYRDILDTETSAPI